jgi:hypothetical protein
VLKYGQQHPGLAAELQEADGWHAELQRQRRRRAQQEGATDSETVQVAPPGLPDGLSSWSAVALSNRLQASLAPHLVSDPRGPASASATSPSLGHAMAGSGNRFIDLRLEMQDLQLALSHDPANAEPLVLDWPAELARRDAAAAAAVDGYNRRHHRHRPLHHTSLWRQSGVNRPNRSRISGGDEGSSDDSYHASQDEDWSDAEPDGLQGGAWLAGAGGALVKQGGVSAQWRKDGDSSADYSRRVAQRQLALEGATAQALADALRQWEEAYAVGAKPLPRTAPRARLLVRRHDTARRAVRSAQVPVAWLVSSPKVSPGSDAPPRMTPTGLSVSARSDAGDGKVAGLLSWALPRLVFVLEEGAVADQQCSRHA